MVFDLALGPRRVVRIAIEGSTVGSESRNKMHGRQDQDSRGTNVLCIYHKP